MSDNNPKSMLVPFALLSAQRADIPLEYTGVAGRASYNLGFPPETMTPIAAGGTPPFGIDMNGVLYDITSHVAYISRGNFYHFDPAVVDAGGYAQGEVCIPDDPTWPMVLRSAINGNTTNFNDTLEAIGAQWTVLGVLLSYSPTYNYPIPNLLVYHNNLLYRNVVVTGPKTENVATPGTNNAIWEPWVPGAQGEYRNIPDTLALRDSWGKTQVSDPVEDQDAVPYKFMRDYVDSRTSGDSELSKPVITAPPSGSVIGALTFKVTVTPLELLSGGTPNPTRTQVRVLSDDLATIYVNTVQPYSLTPTVYLPDDFPVETPFWVIVRHEDSYATWSPWSDATNIDGVRYTLNPVSLNRVAIVYPSNGSTTVPLTNLTLIVAAGSWTDGSAFTGTLTRCAIHSESDDSVVWETGTSGNPWVSYRTSITVPDAVLSPNTNYWIEAQHQAASAPSTNPAASLTTGAYTKEFPEAARVKTIAASAPNVQNLQHDVPPEVMHGSFTDVHIWGATSTDGGFVTYVITNIVGGLSFSKTTGIVDNETVQMVAPTLTADRNASFSIIARSSFGADSVPTSVSVYIKVKKLQDSLSVNRHSLASTSNGTYMAFGGGLNYVDGQVSIVDIYNNNLTHTIAPALSIARAYLAATSDSTYMMFGGGRAGAIFFSAVDVYDNNLTHTLASELSVPHGNLAATSNGNYKLFAGGYRSPGIDTSVVDAYDDNLVHMLAPELFGDLQSPAATSNGNYMLFTSKIPTDAITTVNVYDNNLTHTMAPALSVPRGSLAATSDGTYMIFGGGISGVNYPVVDVYDSNLTHITVHPLSVARNMLAATSDGTHMIFGGGNSGGVYSSAVDAYDNNLTHTLFPALSVARDNFTATSDGINMMFGGGRALGATASSFVDAYDSNLDHWSA